MYKLDQQGVMNGLLLPLVVVSALMVAAIGFGGWAYTQMTDYRDNIDQKVAAAVDEATKIESAAKDKQFAEQNKSPLKSYNGPSAYGSIRLSYPKSWGGYVDDSGRGDSLVDGYFNLGVVPSVSDQKSVFALRIQVSNSAYKDTLENYSGPQQEGKIKVSAYSLPKLPKVVGVRVVGQLEDGKNINLVVLPLRSQTIKIWTEGNQSITDFNKYILPNFSFSP